MAKNSPMDALVELHKVDGDIDKLKSQRELLPVSLRRIETRLNRQRQTIEEKKARLKALRTETHAKETAIRGLDEDIKKLTVQLNMTRNNKEYAAAQHEIAGKKADSSRIEDQVLSLMTETEDAERDIRELEQSVAQVQREYDEEARGVEKDLSELDARIAAAQARRSGLAAGVDEELLAEYERIASKKGASALAVVVGNTCQGCFMQLPPQFGNVLRGGRRVVRCPSCGRLLYLA
jgi:predicted  nucleic acid-binding Zn-ribbon protein